MEALCVETAAENEDCLFGIFCQLVVVIIQNNMRVRINTRELCVLYTARKWKCMNTALMSAISEVCKVIQLVNLLLFSGTTL
jgi:hypothetical protein